MLKKNSVGIIAIVVVLVALATVGILSTGLAQSSENKAVVPAQPPSKAAAQPENNKSLLAAPDALKIDVEAAMKDRVLGKDTAPVTITEYASLTCSHCAHFAKDVLPEVKKRLLDTGKAKLVFRDFPLDNPALRAAMMARCSAPDKYFNLIEVIFNNNEQWARSKDPLESLAQLGSLAGIDKAYFNACTTNTELETAILNRMQEAQTAYKIRATPTFVFNDGVEVLNGAQTPEKFEEIVNSLTKGK